MRPRSLSGGGDCSDSDAIEELCRDDGTTKRAVDDGDDDRDDDDEMDQAASRGEQVHDRGT